VITPVYGNEKIEEAEGRLARFTRDVVPILDTFIPKKLTNWMADKQNRKILEEGKMRIKYEPDESA